RALHAVVHRGGRRLIRRPGDDGRGSGHGAGGQAGDRRGSRIDDERAQRRIGIHVAAEIQGGDLEGMGPVRQPREGRAHGGGRRRPRAAVEPVLVAQARGRRGIVHAGEGEGYRRVAGGPTRRGGAGADRRRREGGG